jgi:hypothetical protein
MGGNDKEGGGEEGGGGGGGGGGKPFLSLVDFYIRKIYRNIPTQRLFKSGASSNRTQCL